jgi:hypothetical protein
MAKWKRRQEEVPGDYRFSGRALMTAGVTSSLSEEDVAAIVLDLVQSVIAHNGLDYHQVFEADDGRVVWAIDSLTATSMTDGSYSPEQVAEYNHWTILLPSEY